MGLFSTAVVLFDKNVTLLNWLLHLITGTYYWPCQASATNTFNSFCKESSIVYVWVGSTYTCGFVLSVRLYKFFFFFVLWLSWSEGTQGWFLLSSNLVNVSNKILPQNSILRELANTLQINRLEWLHLLQCTIDIMFKGADSYCPWSTAVMFTASFPKVIVHSWVSWALSM